MRGSAGVDAAREVAGGDRAGGDADAVQRAQPDADQPPRKGTEREQDPGDDQCLDAQQAVQRRVGLASAGPRRPCRPPSLARGDVATR